MPYRCIWNDRLVTTIFSGNLLPQEVLGSVVEVTADPRFDDLDYIVNDFTTVETHGINTEAVSEGIGAISYGTMLTNPVVRVIVITRDAGIVALAERMKEPPYEDIHKVFVFATIDEADCWRESQAKPIRHVRLTKF